MELIIIAAVGQNGVVGKNNKLPWKLPKDLKHFKEVTMGMPVLMGRKTFESLGKPLPGRENVVISRSMKSIPGATVFSDLSEAILHLAFSSSKVYVIGGSEIYEKLMFGCMKMVITEVHAKPDGDAFFPQINEDEWHIERGSTFFDNNILCNIATYERRNVLMDEDVWVK